MTATTNIIRNSTSATTISFDNQNNLTTIWEVTCEKQNITMPENMFCVRLRPGTYAPRQGDKHLPRIPPLNLIYVANLARMGNMNPADKNIYAAVDTGLISQNVYLFCSSEGLATVILGMVDKATLAKAMGLSSSQKIIFTQPVGYPKR